MPVAKVAKAPLDGGAQPRWLRGRDPRLSQTIVLGLLVAWGVLALDLEIQWLTAASILVAAQATQAGASRWAGIPYDPRSALISSLSLILLLRTSAPWIAVVAAVATIAGKFLIRVGHKHVFNPTNFGIAVALLVFDGAWVSPGQWGSTVVWGLAIAGIGGLVVFHSSRSDITWAFLACWSAILVGRALVLGHPLQIPFHQLQNGAFLIFAFLMISDPKTTPDTRPGRLLFAALVAAVAGVLRFAYYEPNALIWALFACAPTVPLIDRWLPGLPYTWRRPTVGSLSPSLGGAT